MRALNTVREICAIKTRDYLLCKFLAKNVKYWSIWYYLR